MVEQRAIAIFGRLQLLEEFAELHDLVGADLGVLRELLGLVAVVRDAVMGLGDADVRVAAVARLVADHEREHPGHVRLIGQRDEVEPEVNDAFARTGTTHLLAVSGLQLQVLAAALWFAFRALGLPRRPAYLAVALGTVGYAAMFEQFTPSDLLRWSRQAEEAGFGAIMASDHFNPWTPQQGQAGFGWSWLGALGATTQRGTFGTGVTAPGFRYHPAILAQAAATLGRPESA